MILKMTKIKITIKISINHDLTDRNGDIYDEETREKDREGEKNRVGEDKGEKTKNKATLSNLSFIRFVLKS